MSGNVFSHMPLEQVQILYRHEFFFRPYFHYCLRILHYCKDGFHIHVIIIIVIYHYIKPFISASSMLFNMI